MHDHSDIDVSQEPKNPFWARIVSVPFIKHDPSDLGLIYLQ